MKDKINKTNVARLMEESRKVIESGLDEKYK